MSNNVVVLALSDAVAGALGALASTALCYPLDHAKVQVQARSHSREASDEEEAGVDESQAQVEKETLLRSRTIAQLMRMLKEGGVRRVYGGVEAKCLNSISSSFIYFLAYAFLKGALARRGSSSGGKPQKPSILLNLIIGCVSGAANVLIMLPFDNVCTRLQSSPNEVGQHPSAMDVISRLRRERIQSFWRGLVPSLILTCNPAIYHTMFDTLKAVYLNRRGQGFGSAVPRTYLDPLRAFWLAAAAKSVATVLTYPLIRAKVVLMAGRAHGSHNPAMGIIACLHAIASSEGLQGLYTGCGGQLLHTILKGAVMLALKEKISSLSDASVRQLLHQYRHGYHNPLP